MREADAVLLPARQYLCWLYLSRECTVYVRWGGNHNDMNRDYDIFEKLPDASVRCLTRVHGTLHVSKVLEQWGKQTTNECFAMNVRSREIIARVNEKPTQRAQLLRDLTKNR